MGSFAAVSEIMLIIEGSFKKAGTLIAMYITAAAIIIYHCVVEKQIRNCSALVRARFSFEIVNPRGKTVFSFNSSC